MIRSNHTCYVLITRTRLFYIKDTLGGMIIITIKNLYDSISYKLISIYFKIMVAINNQYI